jgi:hypothetical protein
MFLNEISNTLIIGKSGTGKTLQTKKIIKNFINQDEEKICMIVDRGGSYNDLVKNYNGINIEIKPNNVICINPFIFNNYQAKLLLIQKLFFDIELIYLNIDRIEQIQKIPNGKDQTKEREEQKLKIKKYKEQIQNKTQEIKKIINLTEFRNNDKIIYDNNEEPISTEFIGSKPMVKVKEFVEIFKEMLNYSYLYKNMKAKIEKYLYQLFEEMIIKKVNLNKNNEEKLYLLISELQVSLKTLFIENEDIDNEQVKVLLFDIEEYINPSQFGRLFNGEPKINIENNNLINIDFGEIQNEKMINLVFSSILMNCSQIITNDKNKKVKKKLIIEGSMSIFNSIYPSSLIQVANLFRNSKYSNSSIVLTAQVISDIYKTGVEVEEEKKLEFDNIVIETKNLLLLGNHSKKDTMERLNLDAQTAHKIEENKSFDFYLNSQVKGFEKLIVEGFVTQKEFEQSENKTNEVTKINNLEPKVKSPLAETYINVYEANNKLKELGSNKRICMKRPTNNQGLNDIKTSIIVLNKHQRELRKKGILEIINKYENKLGSKLDSKNENENENENENKNKNEFQLLYKMNKKQIYKLLKLLKIKNKKLDKIYIKLFKKKEIKIFYFNPKIKRKKLIKEINRLLFYNKSEKTLQLNQKSKKVLIGLNILIEHSKEIEKYNKIREIINL